MEEDRAMGVLFYQSQSGAAIVEVSRLGEVVLVRTRLRFSLLEVRGRWKQE